MSDTSSRREEQRLKQWFFLALEYPAKAPTSGKVACGIIYVCIVVNAILVCIPSDWLSSAFDGPILVLSIISSCVFACEYAARVWIADRVRPRLSPSRARLRYMVSPMGQRPNAWEVTPYAS